jgi:hypothetical protein
VGPRYSDQLAARRRYPVVVLQTTDKPFLNAAAVVTRNRLESIGFKVIFRQVDWSSSLDRQSAYGCTRERWLEPAPHVDHGTRKHLAEQIQILALTEVTYVPWGEWGYPTAFRKSVKDVVKFVSPVFWNVRKA